jgi:hypothetical protein
MVLPQTCWLFVAQYTCTTVPRARLTAAKCRQREGDQRLGRLLSSSFVSGVLALFCCHTIYKRNSSRRLHKTRHKTAAAQDVRRCMCSSACTYAASVRDVARRLSGARLGCQPLHNLRRLACAFASSDFETTLAAAREALGGSARGAPRPPARWGRVGGWRFLSARFAGHCPRNLHLQWSCSTK